MKRNFSIRFLFLLISCIWICPVLFAQSPDTTGKSGILFRNPLDFALHTASKAYQILLSEQLSAQCNFSPTCSRYSAEAFRQFPFWKAWALTTDRLTRCNPAAHEHSPACLTNPENGSIRDSVAWDGIAEMKQRREALVNKLLAGGDSLMAEKIKQSSGKSALLAGVYSALVPGSGKWYLGYPKQAWSTFTTNLFLAAAATEMLLVSGSDPLKLATAGLFASFWMGNVWGSVQLKHRTDMYPFLAALYPHSYGQQPQDKAGQPLPLPSLSLAWEQKDYSLVYRLSQPPSDSGRVDFETLTMRWKAMIELEMFAGCKEEMAKVFAHDSIHLGKITALPIEIQQKSPLKAQRLSAWLPGLGQSWAGYPLKGLISFVLNAGSLVLAWKAVESGLYVNAALFGIYPFIRFYKGGKTYSYSLADRTNQKRMNVLKGKYRNIVEER